MMLTWPVPRWIPSYSYHQRPRAFGAPRDHGRRKHAGCDLYAPDGSPVLAVWAGRVLRAAEFYGKADAIEIDHGIHGVWRYGELHADKKLPDHVQAGQPLGTIATLVGLGNVHPMLHLEIYTGKAKGRLTKKEKGNLFQRREDLVDPTPILDRILVANLTGIINARALA